LPYRSNIEKLAEFAFGRLDQDYVARTRRTDRHVVIAGRNYGQGSSREHAAIAPRYLGLRLVLAKSYARIHWQNLANFGVLALEFTDESDYDRVDVGNLLTVDGLTDALHRGGEVAVHNVTSGHIMTARHRLSPRQVAMVLAGGRIPQVRSRSATSR
jgi:aconitate hydratase